MSTTKASTRQSTEMSYRALEPRMVFDAALAATVEHVSGAAAATPDTAATAVVEPGQHVLLAALTDHYNVPAAGLNEAAPAEAAPTAQPAAATLSADAATDRLALQLTTAAKLFSGPENVAPPVTGQPHASVVFVDSRVADL
jgi:hypothetical protein